METVSIVEGIGLANSFYETLKYVLGIAGTNVISALFKHDCTKVEGSKDIIVDLHPDPKNNAIWWYSVKPVDDYIFVRTPLIESCGYEIAGQEEGEAQPDAKYWRWVATGLPGRIYGGDSVNLKVDFIIYGYKPKALIEHFSTR